MKRYTGNMRRGALVLFSFFALLFLLVTGRFLYLQITGEANGYKLSAEAAKQHNKDAVIEAKRGSILDRNGEVISENTATYTLAAVVSKKTANNQLNASYVSDKEKTATVLAKYIRMSRAEILKRLNKKKAYQVEFGKAGKKISTATKSKLEKEKLPGIIFTRQPQRFYPNGIFASELIGFAQPTSEDKGTSPLAGKMGLEKSYNDILTGKNGKLHYRTDSAGYILPNAKTNVEKAKDGSDIQLTIDKKIQTFLEDTMTNVSEKYKPKNVMAVVMNPKTGEILAMSQRPSFNPANRQDLVSKNVGVWQNLPVEYPYEPGSVMKIFSLAAAIDRGVYNPNEYYKSGIYKVGDIPIHDHNNGNGWGTISYREGVERSSNVAFAKLLDKIGTDRFKGYLEEFGFGKKTGFTRSYEVPGKILYRYPVEKVTTAFGQGTTVSMMQMLQGASAIASDGKTKRPYVVSSISDPNTKKSLKTDIKITGQPISENTAKKTREELIKVVNGKHGTGKLYAIPGYEVSGKTGTSQIPDPKTGKYMTGKENYIFSFMGMAPANDPQLVMYVSMQQPKLEGSDTGAKAVSEIFNPAMKNSLQYMNIKPSEQKKLSTKTVPSLTGKRTEEAKKLLSKEKLVPVVVGSGKKIIQQIPQAGASMIEGQKVVIMTDGNMTVPDLIGLSKKDALKVSEITGVPFTFKGSGYVKNQSVSKGSLLNSRTKMEITLTAPENIPEYNQNKDQKEDDQKNEASDVQENEGVGDLLRTTR